MGTGLVQRRAVLHVSTRVEIRSYSHLRQTVLELVWKQIKTSLTRFQPDYVVKIGRTPNYDQPCLKGETHFKLDLAQLNKAAVKAPFMFQIYEDPNCTFRQIHYTVGTS